jgi:hypothetical protein
MTGTQRPNSILGEIALHRKLVESRNHDFDCPPPRLLLLDYIGMALPTPGVRETERADYRRQHQPLTYQRRQDDGKCQEKNQSAIGERLSVCNCNRTY